MRVRPAGYEASKRRVYTTVIDRTRKVSVKCKALCLLPSFDCACVHLGRTRCQSVVKGEMLTLEVGRLELLPAILGGLQNFSTLLAQTVRVMGI